MPSTMSILSSSVTLKKLGLLILTALAILDGLPLIVVLYQDMPNWITVPNNTLVTSDDSNAKIVRTFENSQSEQTQMAEKHQTLTLDKSKLKKPAEKLKESEVNQILWNITSENPQLPKSTNSETSKQAEKLQTQISSFTKLTERTELPQTRVSKLSKLTKSADFPITRTSNQPKQNIPTKLPLTKNLNQFKQTKKTELPLTGTSNHSYQTISSKISQPLTSNQSKEVEAPAIGVSSNQTSVPPGSLPIGIPPPLNREFGVSHHVPKDVFNMKAVNPRQSVCSTNRKDGSESIWPACFKLDPNKTENSQYRNYTINLVPQAGIEILNDNPDIQPGGVWRPKHCDTKERVAVVIPFRNRTRSLSILIRNLHGILHQQNLAYQIFVVEQIGDQIFNKGKLINVAFAEANAAAETNECPFDCFVFNDVDFNPVGPGPYFGCSDQPKVLSFDKKVYLNYEHLGGVINIRKDHFELINGFSNLFWGWGGEDDDAYKRAKAVGFNNIHPPEPKGKFQVVPHKKHLDQVVNHCRRKLYDNIAERMVIDGLNSLNYTAVQRIAFPLYQWVLVDLLHDDKKFHETNNLCDKAKKTPKKKTENENKEKT